MGCLRDYDPLHSELERKSIMGPCFLVRRLTKMEHYRYLAHHPMGVHVGASGSG
jgi:hypothetical protein